MSPHDWAATYAAAGFVLIPLHPDSKVPARAWKQYQDRRPERSELAAWWPEADHVPYGFGLVCGHLSGVTVIDADAPDGVKRDDSIAHEVLRRYVDDDPRIPTVRTRRGLHAYFAFNGERNRTAFRAFSDGSHLDRRGEGGYVILPPTPGKAWERTVPRELWQRVPAAWARSAQEDRPPAPPHTPADGPVPAWGRDIPQGQRHATFVAIAGGMVRRGADPSEIADELARLNATRCRPPFTPAELRQELDGILSSVGGWS